MMTNICPECGHKFLGHGFTGIDSHWKAHHSDVMPYHEAWPLIKSGRYPGQILIVEKRSSVRRKPFNFAFEILSEIATGG